MLRCRMVILKCGQAISRHLLSMVSWFTSAGALLASLGQLRNSRLTALPLVRLVCSARFRLTSPRIAGASAPRPVAGCSAEHPAQSGGEPAASASQSAMAPGKRCIIAPWAREGLTPKTPLFRGIPRSWRQFLPLVIWFLCLVHLGEETLFSAVRIPARL